MLPKVIKQNGDHELYMNMYAIVGQRYYYIDNRKGGNKLNYIAIMIKPQVLRDLCGMGGCAT